MVESNLLNQNEKYIKTFDLKMLYTKIPYQKLRENIKDFISSFFSLNRFRPVTDVRATKVAVRNLIRGPIKLTENCPLCYSSESLLNYVHFDTI